MWANMQQDSTSRWAIPKEAPGAWKMVFLYSKKTVMFSGERFFWSNLIKNKKQNKKNYNLWLHALTLVPSFLSQNTLLTSVDLDNGGI